VIPNNAFTTIPVVGTFLYLQDVLYPPLTQTVMGGIALNDPSQGRLYQPWTVAYDGTNILVNPGSAAVVFTLAAADVTSVSLAFDSSMAIVLCWTTSTGAAIYYYDTVSAAYTTRTFSGFTSCRVCVDDPRAFNTGASDVIFGYTNAGSLCYRQQRDRYNIEYIIISTAKLLTRMGPSTVDRLQFETA
jgi:hypothetical protein